MIIVDHKLEKNLIQINILKFGTKSSSFHQIEILLVANLVYVNNKRETPVFVNGTKVDPNQSYRTFLPNIPGYVEISY
jgi:hypothetical protein